MKEFESLFVTCGTGIEELLAEELKELGVKKLEVGFRGVYVDQWDWSTVYTINYASRLAVRVLLPLTRFRCYDGKSLYQAASRINWVPYIKHGQTIAIDANVDHRALRNSLYAAQIVKDAICDQLREKTGSRPSVNVQQPDIQLNLFVHQERAVLSYDTSCVPLHKRGYRVGGTEAPMQETLAAALLKLANYSREDILLDPCCGSGTILIEAALMASNTPPGFLRRHWGFMHHPAFDQMEWLKVRNELDSARIPLVQNHFYGIDLSREAVRISKVNLKAVGFSREIEISQQDLREYIPSIKPTLIIANPPYGKRLEEENLKPIYRGLGNMVKAVKSRAAILTNSMELAKDLGLAMKKRYVLNNGGIETYLLVADAYE